MVRFAGWHNLSVTEVNLTIAQRGLGKLLQYLGDARLIVEFPKCFKDGSDGLGRTLHFVLYSYLSIEPFHLRRTQKTFYLFCPQFGTTTHLEVSDWGLNLVTRTIRKNKKAITQWVSQIPTDFEPYVSSAFTIAVNSRCSTIQVDFFFAQRPIFSVDSSGHARSDKARVNLNWG